MIDDVSDISAYYIADPEREHTRLERHQLEFDLTWRNLERFLPAQGTILEIGAATGRYTLPLAQRGYQITAVDLTPALLDLNRQQIAAAGLDDQVRFVAADARDLASVTARDFDAVLLMGPLYHLIAEADRRAALRQAADRLRDGGVLFSALISRFGVFGDLIRNDPGWIEDQAEVEALVASGHRPDEAPRGGFRGYFARVDEIAPLHEALGFEPLALVGVEPAIGAADADYNGLQGDQRRRWLDLLDRISTEPSIVGASRHLLYVGRKQPRAGQTA